MATTKKLYTAIKDEYETASVMYAHEEEMYHLTGSVHHYRAQMDAMSLIDSLDVILEALPFQERQAILTSARTLKVEARGVAREHVRKQRASAA